MSRHAELDIGCGKLSLRVQCGEITGQQKWSETKVSSSGGGGYVGPQGGHVSSPTITSETKTRQEIWIREEDGLESSLELSNKAFPVNHGQRVWIASGANSKERDTARYLIAYNQASDRYFDFLDNWTGWLYESKLIKKPMIYQLLTFWLSLLLSIITIWVALPVFGKIGLPHSFSQFYQILLTYFLDPHFYKKLFQQLSAASTGDILLFAFYTLISWGFIYFILNFAGRILFLNRWERKQTNNAYHAVLRTCKELADDYNGLQTTSENG